MPNVPMNTEANLVLLDGKKLKCPFCAGERFHHRHSLLNTRRATFFKFDWLNKEAQNYVCDGCGYIFWFLRKDAE
jgi:transposase-like protein